MFEVKIRVNEFDSILRPAMTTKNSIITSVVKNVVYIPLEAVFVQDSVTFSYKMNGSSIVKQQIKTGQRNENEIIITEGLKESDVVLLNAPENSDKLKLKNIEK